MIKTPWDAPEILRAITAIAAIVLSVGGVLVYLQVRIEQVASDHRVEAAALRTEAVGRQKVYQEWHDQAIRDSATHEKNDALFEASAKDVALRQQAILAKTVELEQRINRLEELVIAQRLREKR
jgi:hypothetical protein